MTRDEAWQVITRIASSELIDNVTARNLISARDVVICAPNKKMNILVDDECRRDYTKTLKQLLDAIYDFDCLNLDIRKGITKVRETLDKGFEPWCMEPCLKIRCGTCPGFYANGEDCE